MVYAKIFGKITTQTRIDGMKKEAKLLNNHPGFGALIDLREMDYTFHPNDMLSISQVLSERKHSYRSSVALLVREEQMAVALSLCTIACSRGIDMQVFSVMVQAK